MIPARCFARTLPKARKMGEAQFFRGVYALGIETITDVLEVLWET